MSHVRHAAGSSSAPAFSFVLVVVPAHLGSGSETTRRTHLLLNVVSSLSTPATDGVRLIVSRARTADTFRHLTISACAQCE